eukprot:14270886-Ditylum_brightwellii.AAC.1
MHSPNNAPIKWLVYSFNVVLFQRASLVGFRAPRLPCLSGSAARSQRSVSTAGTLNRGRKCSLIASSK